MNNYADYIGIDLGTSSVKILALCPDGSIKKARQPYSDISPEGWWTAVLKALSAFSLENCKGIGLCSQVGTYIVNDSDVYSWNSSIGWEELSETLELTDEDTWIQEIGMVHPPILSYPLPRLRYFQKHYPELHSIRMPKEEILLRLTGTLRSDCWSFRGLAHPHSTSYSKTLLKLAGIPEEILPPLSEPFSCAGTTKRIVLHNGQTLPGGIPVYTGMNDFYASLFGLGVQENELFDITGTSEHLGILRASFSADAHLPCGPYLTGHVHYGVTASSGDSLHFGQRLFPDIFSADFAESLPSIQKEKPPLFLPYLSGERAPIFDPYASGVFFGLTNSCTARSMAYAVLEGVTFSLYHIYEALGQPVASALKVVGGASDIPSLNQLKANLFQLPVIEGKEPDASALGALMTALVGNGRYQSPRDAQKELCLPHKTTWPERDPSSELLERYRIYQSLYPLLKDSMHRFSKLS